MEQLFDGGDTMNLDLTKNQAILQVAATLTAAALNARVELQPATMTALCTAPAGTPGLEDDMISVIKMFYASLGGT